MIDQLGETLARHRDTSRSGVTCQISDHDVAHHIEIDVRKRGMALLCGPAGKLNQLVADEAQEAPRQSSIEVWV